MIKKILGLMMLVMIGLSSRSFAAGDSLTFICHKGLNYSRVDVSYAFKAYLDEPRPIDNKKLHGELLKFIGYTPEKYKAIWSKMFFRRALFIPRMVESDEEVIKWVAASYGGVGYVSQAPHNNPNVEVCGQ